MSPLKCSTQFRAGFPLLPPTITTWENPPSPLLSSITSSRADPLSAVRCGSLSLSCTCYLPLRRRESRGGDALPFVLCQVQNVQGIRQSHRIPNSAAPLLLPKPPQAAIVSLAKQQQQEQEEEQQQQLLCDTFGNAFLNCKETKRNVAATKQQQEQQQEQMQRQRREKVFSIFSHCLRTELHLKSAPVKNFEANDYKRSLKNYARN